MENKRQCVVKWRLLVKLNFSDGAELSTNLKQVAKGSGVTVWDFNLEENPNEIHLLLIEDDYWIIQLEARSSII
jgi:hypothetical protein